MRPPSHLEPTMTALALGGDPAQEPPKLPVDAVSVLNGATFMVSDGLGDVAGEPLGMFHRDTRILSRFVLTLEGERLTPLSSGQIDHHEARFFLTNPPLPTLPPDALSVLRHRTVMEALHEGITIRSHLDRSIRLTLAIEVDADFADLFQVKTGTTADRPPPESWIDEQGALRLRHRHDRFEANAAVSVVPELALRERAFVVRVDLPVRGVWHADLWVDAGEPVDRVARGEDVVSGALLRRRATDELERWRADFPQLVSRSRTMQTIFENSIEDLAGLRMRAPTTDDGEVVVPAAGLPWFMALFGRDSVITAFESILFAPRVARGALLALAALQGRRFESFTDQEPGKICHELRHGELTMLGETPHRPYYGSVDATPLWLLLLCEYVQVTGDLDLASHLWGHAERAAGWIETAMAGPHAPLLSYETASPLGIRHQGWKDSVAPIVFRDGRAAEPPIAICEVQGYAAEALERLAALADRLERDAETASRWRRSAGELRTAIEDRLWIDDLGWYAMGLDASGRPIDALGSNLGHLLWCGSVPRERAGRIRDLLRSRQMSSGWGVRTLASDEHAYSPIGYHTGTVWPHDSTLVATGLARNGFPDDAAGLIGDLIRAAARLGHRLPEALAGYDRDESVVPVRYPTACNPQAWTAAAPFQWLRVLLGLEVHDSRPVARPLVHLRRLGPIELTGIHAGGRRWVVRAEGTEAEVEPVG